MSNGRRGSDEPRLTADYNGAKSVKQEQIRVEGNRSLEEVLEELRRVFSDEEIDRLLRQATIRQAEGAPADRDYLLQRIRSLPDSDWDQANPVIVELLRVLAHLVASVETLWATVARLEQRIERLESEDELE
jgi:ubiquinone biosynthesis protein UbiJ